MISVSHRHYHGGRRFDVGGETALPLGAADIAAAWCRSPAHMEWGLMEGTRREDTPAMRRGRLCHMLLLRHEPLDDMLVITGARTWGAQAARDALAEAAATGREAALLHEVEAGQSMAAAIARDRGALYSEMLAMDREEGIIWSEEVGGRTVWLRALHDAIDAERKSAIDYKTAAPDPVHGLRRWRWSRLEDEAGLIRAGHYLASMGPGARLRYLVQETEPPLMSMVIDISDDDGDIGTRAVSMWRTALAYTVEQLAESGSPILSGRHPEAITAAGYDAEAA